MRTKSRACKKREIPEPLAEPILVTGDVRTLGDAPLVVGVSDSIVGLVGRQQVSVGCQDSGVVDGGVVPLTLKRSSVEVCQPSSMNDPKRRRQNLDEQTGLGCLDCEYGIPSLSGSKRKAVVLDGCSADSQTMLLYLCTDRKWVAVPSFFLVWKLQLMFQWLSKQGLPMVANLL